MKKPMEDYNTNEKGYSKLGEERYKQRCRDLQKRINETSKSYYKKKGEGDYSSLPENAKKYEFSDLIENKDNIKMIRNLSQYVKNYNRTRKGIGLIGDTGIGKTTLIGITCKKIVKNYNKTLYFSSEMGMVDEIKKAFDSNSFDSPEDIIRKIGSHDLVFIDELGDISTDWSLSAIKRVIDETMNRGNRLFITSNYNAKQLIERWGGSNNYKKPQQILDRMNEAMNLYQLKGESFRRYI